MRRKLLAFTSTVLLMTNALACGPEYLPRYGTIPHIDLSHRAHHNFALLLASYYSPPIYDQYVDREMDNNQYAGRVAELIDRSGRNGLTVFNFARLQKRFCPENTRGNLQEIGRQFVERHVPRLSSSCSGRCDEWSQKHEIRFDVENLFLNAAQNCGPYSESRASRDVAFMERDSVGSPYNEYAWLALAYHHTFSGGTKAANQYILKLADSPLEGARSEASRLQEINARMASATYPVAIPLHLSSGYSISWCTHKPEIATLQFIESVLASNAKDAEVASLIEARDILRGVGCREMEGEKLERFEALTNAETFTKPAADHAAYIKVARAFYKNDYAQALALANALHGSSEPWVAETAMYLSARIPILQSQKEWDGYSEPREKLEQEQLDAAKRNIQRYLKNYPQGRYVLSAEGLKRMVAHLQGDTATLKSELDKHVNAAADAFMDNSNEQTYERFNRLFIEWRRYAGTNVDYATASPLIIAYDVMSGLEKGDNRLHALEQVESRFAEMKTVYRLLRDMALLQAGEHPRIVSEPAPGAFDDEVDVAIAALYAHASEAAGLLQQARATWLAIHESSEERKAWDTVQASIAKTHVQENDYRGLARKTSHVNLRKIFEDAFSSACDEDVLIEIAADDSLNSDASMAARDEVFRRRIVRGDFGGLHALYGAIKNVGDFSLIATAARQTAQEPDDAKGLLNLGYYMLKKMSPHSSGLPGADSDGFARNCPMTAVTNTPQFGPRDYFYRVIELHEDGHKSADEAKALHYLVLCDKPGYQSRECNWYYPSRQNRPSGKELFERLHDRYPGSKWARDTPYYYD